MKQIIILDCTDASNGFNQNYAFWFTAPVATIVPNTLLTSAYRLASADELDQIRIGNVIEETGTTFYASGTTLASVQSDLVTKYQARLSARTALVNQKQFYSSTYDGTKWS